MKLKVPGAGFLPDMNPYCKGKNTENTGGVLVAQASTILFIPKGHDGSGYVEGNIPAGAHWVDLAPPGTIVVESQPQGQFNAVLGGIMAARMKSLAVKGVVVDGRIRDIEELEDSGLPIWAKATSTVGTGAATTPHAWNVPITISGITVHPGDVVFSDPTNGIVIIPQSKLEKLLELLPRLVEADQKVIEDVKNGVSVQEAFKKHRSGL